MIGIACAFGEQRTSVGDDPSGFIGMPRVQGLTRLISLSSFHFKRFRVV